MSRTIKTFDVSVGADADEPYPFLLKFTHVKTQEVTEHHFSAVAEPGAAGKIALAQVIRFDERGRRGVDLNGLMAFLEKVLVPGDYDRMMALVDDRDLRIELDLLEAVFNWLLEEYNGRPTTPS